MELQKIIVQQQRLHQLEKQEFIKQFTEYKRQQADRIQDLLQTFNISLEKVKQLNNITIQFPRPELQQVQRITQLETENAQLKITTKQQQQQIMQIRNEYKRFVDEVLHKHSSQNHDTFVTQSEEDRIDHMIVKQQLHIDSATQLSLQLLTKTISEMQGQFIQQDNEINLLNKQIRELRTQCEKFGAQCDMQQMEIDQLQWKNKKLYAQLDKTHLLNQIDELQEKNMEVTIEYQKQQQELLQAYTQLSTMKQIIDNSSIQAKKQVNEALMLYESTKIGELQNRLIQQIEDSLHFSKMYKIAHDLMMKKEDINTELRLKIYRYFNFNEHFIDQAKHNTEQQFQLYISTLQDRILEQQTQINSLQQQNNIFNNQIVAVQKENFSLQQENKLLVTTSSSMSKNVTLNNNQILQEKTAELQRRQIYQLQEQNDQLKKQNSELNEKYETEKITKNSQMLNMSLLCDLYKIMYVKLKYQDISKDLNELVIKQIDKLSMGQEIKYFIPPKIIEDMLKAEINVYDFIEKNKYIREALLQQKTSLKMNQHVIDAMVKLRLNDQRIHVTKDKSSYIEQCLDNITNANITLPQEQQSSVIFQDIKSREGNTEKLIIFKQSANIPLTLAAVMSCGMMPIQKWDDEVQVGESIVHDVQCQTDKIEEPPAIQPEAPSKQNKQKQQKKNFRQIKQQHQSKEKQPEKEVKKQIQQKPVKIEQKQIQQQPESVQAASIQSDQQSQEQQIIQTGQIISQEEEVPQQTEQQTEEIELSFSFDESTSESDTVVIESNITLYEDSIPITIKKKAVKSDDQYLSTDDTKTQRQESKSVSINNSQYKDNANESDISQYESIVKSLIEQADIDYQGQKIVIIDEQGDNYHQQSERTSEQDTDKTQDEQAGQDQILIKIKNDGVEATIMQKIQIQLDSQNISEQQQDESSNNVLKTSQHHQEKQHKPVKLYKQPSKQNIQLSTEKIHNQQEQQKILYNNIMCAQGLLVTDDQQNARDQLLQPAIKLSRESTIEEQGVIYQQVQLLQKGLKAFDIVANINQYNENKEQKGEEKLTYTQENSFSTIKLEKDTDKQDKADTSIDEQLYIQSITHNYSLMDMNQILINQLIEADKYVLHQKQQIHYYSQQLMMAQQELYSTKLNYITRNYKVSNIDTIISQKINNNIELLRAQYYGQYDLFAQIFIEIQSQITFISNKMARLDLLKLVNGLDMRLQEVNIKILQVKKRELHQRQQIAKFINLIKKFGRLSDKVYEQMDSRRVLGLIFENPDKIEQILIDSTNNPENLQIYAPETAKNFSNLENASEPQIHIHDIDRIDQLSEAEVEKQQQEIEELEKQIQLQTKQLEHVQTHFEENHQRQVEQVAYLATQPAMPTGLQQYKEQMEKRIQNQENQPKNSVKMVDKDVQAVQQQDSLQYEQQQRNMLLEESKQQSRLLIELDSNLSMNIKQMQEQINDIVDIKQQVNKLNKPNVKARTPSPGYKGRKNSYSMEQYKWQQNNNVLEQIKTGLIKIISQSSLNKEDEFIKLFIKQLSSVIDLLRQSNINNSLLANKLVTMENDFNIIKLSLHEQLHQMQAKQKMQDQNTEHQLLEIMFGPGIRPQTEAKQLSTAGLRPSRHKWRR